MNFTLKKDELDLYAERYGRETSLGRIVSTKTKFPFTLEHLFY